MCVSSLTTNIVSNLHDDECNLIVLLIWHWLFSSWLASSAAHCKPNARRVRIICTVTRYKDFFMKIYVSDNTMATVCEMHWAMLLRVISDRQRHLRWYCLHFSHWRGRRLSWGVGRRDLIQRAAENLILCPRWIKTSKYIILWVKRPSRSVL